MRVGSVGCVLLYCELWLCHPMISHVPIPQSTWVLQPPRVTRRTHHHALVHSPAALPSSPLALGSGSGLIRAGSGSPAGCWPAAPAPAPAAEPLILSLSFVFCVSACCLLQLPLALATPTYTYSHALLGPVPVPGAVGIWAKGPGRGLRDLGGY
jgi:hypothetical protein